MGRRNCQGEQVEEKTWQEDMVEERRRVGAVKLHFPKNICRVLVFDILLLERIITIPPPLPGSAFSISICFFVSLSLFDSTSLFFYIPSEIDWQRIMQINFECSSGTHPTLYIKKVGLFYFILFYFSAVKNKLMHGIR